MSLFEDILDLFDGFGVCLTQAADGENIFLVAHSDSNLVGGLLNKIDISGVEIADNSALVDGDVAYRNSFLLTEDQVKDFLDRPDIEDLLEAIIYFRDGLPMVIVNHFSASVIQQELEQSGRTTPTIASTNPGSSMDNSTNSDSMDVTRSIDGHAARIRGEVAYSEDIDTGQEANFSDAGVSLNGAAPMIPVPPLPAGGVPHALPAPPARNGYVGRLRGVMGDTNNANTGRAV